MYTFELLTEEEYKAFQEKHEFANFLNSIESSKLRAYEGFKTEYVGVKEDGKVVAATILASTKIMKIFRYYNAQRGLLVDYSNLELLSFFTKELKNYLKKQKALFLMANPHIIFETRNNEGELIEGNDNSYILDNMKKVGFLHSGFNDQLKVNSEVQWEYSLYLNGMNEDEVLKHISAKTRYDINKSHKQKVKVRKLEKNEIDIFFNIYKGTAKNKDFDYLLRDDQHYLNMLDFYDGHICIYLAYLNPNETLEQALVDKTELEKKIEVVNEQLETKTNKTLLNKIKEFNIQLDAKNKIIEEMNILNKEYGDEAPLSAAMFIDYPYEISYMYSGSSDDAKLRKFCGTYAIQWETIKYAIDHNINHYNFYGFSGDFSGNDGVLDYKRGFNGVAEKMIGEFELPVKPIMYKLYRAIKK